MTVAIANVDIYAGRKIFGDSTAGNTVSTDRVISRFDDFCMIMKKSA